ncbi:MAG: hypothetical protein Q4D74_09615 [Comamonadaceae bacterium]|nr:hypothetical protein [Comamonadaceae bacterium]
MNALPRSTVVLAQLLERLESSRQPVDAHQYRHVASRLAEALADAQVDAGLLLQACRPAAELYENLHYATAGLCRSPLEAAMRAEAAARAAIDAARRKPAATPPDAALGT